jgi:hypothetical protein
MLASIWNLLSRTLSRPSPPASPKRPVQTFRLKTLVRRVIARRRTEKALAYSCPDMDLCLALDKHKFESWFKFSTFQYAANVQKLVTKSKNGLVHVVTYTRPSLDGTSATAYAVLKSQLVDDADSLWYEYLVGQFLNKHRNRFPVFVGTYGIYDETSGWDVDVASMKTKLHPTPVTEFRMKSSMYSPVLLLQYAPGEMSFADFLKSPSATVQDFFAILYHLYFALARLAKVFTHYDLHLFKGKNVSFRVPRRHVYVSVPAKNYRLRAVLLLRCT